MEYGDFAIRTTFKSVTHMLLIIYPKFKFMLTSGIVECFNSTFV